MLRIPILMIRCDISYNMVVMLIAFCCLSFVSLLNDRFVTGDVGMKVLLVYMHI